jgi:hypothetical protein
MHNWVGREVDRKVSRADNGSFEQKITLRKIVTLTDIYNVTTQMASITPRKKIIQDSRCHGKACRRIRVIRGSSSKRSKSDCLTVTWRVTAERRAEFAEFCRWKTELMAVKPYTPENQMCFGCKRPEFLKQYEDQFVLSKTNGFMTSLLQSS